MRAPLELITQAAFYIEGEKPLPPDKLSGLQQMTLTGSSRDQNWTVVPQHDGARGAAVDQTTV
jgi:hypothetical protein